ncbi:hypothetical protein [Rhodoplanes serenus]|uniref:hypothetical protein n=1 Tax=Rhodoplanes serenus TaxID=200615 RepID=UPI000DACE7A8|nr:hypothetical protein [Rhodoplanes serenus]RAI34529.1 hypothetical protein CH340_08865 [Rhodoplanes serenus]
MPDRPALSDNEVHDRLVAACDVLGDRSGATTRGDTALKAARKALRLFQLGLVMAMEQAEPTDRPPPDP